MFTEKHLHRAHELSKGTMLETLGMRFSVEPNGSLAAHMPVDHRTIQPAGLLHGGATAALAETLGSLGSALLSNLEEKAVVGTNINVNHLRSVRSGEIKAVGELVHQGRTLHVWEIRVSDEKGKLIAVCRLTNLILNK